MLVFIIRRLLQTIPVALGVTFAVFAILHLIPGDPAIVIAGEAADPAQVEQIRINLGLNDPFLVQYGRYLGRLVQGDMGTSIRSSRPVAEEIFERRFFITVELAIVSTAFTSLIGLIIGVISATRRHTPLDVGLMLFSLLGLAMPNFWLGILLMSLLGVQLGLFPLIGWGTPAQIVLPALTLGIGGSALIARMTRASLLDVLTKDYIRTAHAKGISERIIIYKHALRNALIPVITVVGLSFGSMLSGAILTETIFAINGMGRLIVDSIRDRDFPVAQGAILVTSMMFVLVNCLVDVVYRMVNRRVDLN